MGHILFFREKGEVSELLQVLANKMSLETLEEEEGNQSPFNYRLRSEGDNVLGSVRPS